MFIARLLLVLSSTVATLTSGAAIAQVGRGATVHECDLLAAHPFDPQRMAEGVADDRIIPRLAIRECEAAHKETPQDPRFAFQLGRALLAAGRAEDAVKQFRVAAEAGHAAAWAYIGDAHQLGQGAAPSPPEAFAAYGKALAGGFTRAQSLLDQLNFDRSLFASSVLDDLFNSRHAALRTRMTSGPESERWPERAYFFSLAQKLVSECGRILTPDAMLRLYNLRFGSGWSGEAEARVGMTVYASVGDYDGNTFVRRHGCEGPTSKQIFAGIVEYLRGEPSR
ncbi:MAG: hypothetical protein JNK84_23085 [Phreatobacter sp.]|uniref:hypothetical protein n=1 Tax=Phreatobacter sp. TaxID=1966341 RepID=UPI001A486C80|nr:hypothetical protein [Phreatobacter sp.]MBL8571970.1 hypothetical protein [Phreatobacter sp.]